MFIFFTLDSFFSSDISYLPDIAPSVWCWLAEEKMASTPPEDYPITGVIVVADPSKCPPGYDLVMWCTLTCKQRINRFLHWFYSLS